MLYSRILLKLSGEALMGRQSFGIDPETIKSICLQIRDVKELGIEMGIVVGGGNIYRGLRAEKQGIKRVTGDYMGMIATIFNSLALQNILESNGVETRVQSALHVEKVTEPYINRKAIKHLEKGRVVIFAAGTGGPFFTTDTAAALRAIETSSNVLLKATRVNGVYDKDPERYSDAKFYSKITYRDFLEKGLKVMDATAITLCSENNLPVIVFNIRGKNNLKKIVLGEDIGTMIREVI
ncbi:MAG TPA: UMP kinase [Syntrophorhabdaceae bacterium]|nr:UMP kinase [Syntrophorhabdaceae bacterium]HON84557.1 UMP kinase [Syntrophorhabdaceae bacterium]HPC66237.1 UMP kinase [Syntrophorhabdaceae bacterium]HPP41610.1 UMP kinase [Syntrophorhabdaceae bacterium]HQE79086.1 UMP kinase [Syntrophorhabdaceae bacterium]